MVAAMLAAVVAMGISAYRLLEWESLQHLLAQYPLFLVHLFGALSAAGIALARSLA